MEINIQIETMNEEIEIPKYSNDGDAGVDVRAFEDVIIYPRETKLIRTGLKFNIPKGYEIQVRPRSGLSLNTPLRIVNSPGTIDSGYKDEVGIIVNNSSYQGDNNYLISEKGNKEGIYLIKKGDRIAQLVLKKYETIVFEKIDKIDDSNTRGGGFGSTGVK